MVSAVLILLLKPPWVYSDWGVLTIGAHDYDPEVARFRRLYGDPKADYNHNRAFLAMRAQLVDNWWWGMHYMRYSTTTDKPVGDYTHPLAISYFAGSLFYQLWPGGRVMPYAGAGLDLVAKYNRTIDRGSLFSDAGLKRTDVQIDNGLVEHLMAGCTVRLISGLSVEAGTIWVDIDNRTEPNEGDIGGWFHFFALSLVFGYSEQ